MCNQKSGASLNTPEHALQNRCFGSATGHIPKVLVKLPVLEEIDLHGNRFFGERTRRGSSVVSALLLSGYAGRAMHSHCCAYSLCRWG